MKSKHSNYMQGKIRFSVGDTKRKMRLLIEKWTKICPTFHLPVLENNPGYVAFVKKKKKKVAEVINIAKDTSCKPKAVFFVLFCFVFNMGFRKLGRSLAQKKNYVYKIWKPAENPSHFLSNNCGDQIYQSFQRIPTVSDRGNLRMHVQVMFLVGLKKILPIHRV